MWGGITIVQGRVASAMGVSRALLSEPVSGVLENIAGRGRGRERGKVVAGAMRVKR